jgi:Na+/melibiose symporter-like transporter
MVSVTGERCAAITTDGDSLWHFNSSPRCSFWLEFYSARKRMYTSRSAPLPTNLRRPRWLVEHGRIEAARRSLAWLRALDSTDPTVVKELKDIQQDVDQRRLATEQGWTVLFTNRPLFNRLWRAALLQFMAQMCGNTSMKYYLPSIFMSLGIERKTTLMIGGIESTLKIGCTIIDTWLVDRFGRRLTLVISCLVMSVALLVSVSSSFVVPSSLC